MKQILVSQLKIGDLFIDGPILSTLEVDGRYYSNNVGYTKVKLIVGPTIKPTYVSPSREYFLALSKKVLLCERVIC